MLTSTAYRSSIIDTIFRIPIAVAAVVAAALLAGCGGSVVPMSSVAKTGSTRVLHVPLGPRSIVPGAGASAVSLCPSSGNPLEASCLSSVRMMSSTTGAFPDSVDGLTPNDLASIYNYPAPGLQAPTTSVIGIVVAYDNANAEADLAAYRSYFGLPPCTSANGCFEKVGAAAPASDAGTTSTSDVRRRAARTSHGISAHPTSTGGGWAGEADTDIEAASAICNNCQIVLAEAASSNLYDLANAVAAAVGAGANVVSVSFGATESISQLGLEPAFEPAPVKVFAAAGDYGGQVLFPADLTNVIAVAGTTLDVNGMTVTQNLWQNSGGGCSNLYPAPAFEPNWCPLRSIADLAAVADPNTGIAFYDGARGGWGIVGGTSVSTPIVASMSALSGDTVAGVGAQTLYANAAQFLQVGGAGTIGGLGTPDGLTAF